MKKALTALAASAALGLAMVTVPVATAMAQDDHRNDTIQTQHPDYSKNKFYALGNREGYQDYQRKTQRPNHDHKYGNDNDRAAHDYGYQQGLHGQRGYKADTDRH